MANKNQRFQRNFARKNNGNCSKVVSDYDRSGCNAAQKPLESAFISRHIPFTLQPKRVGNTGAKVGRKEQTGDKRGPTLVEQMKFLGLLPKTCQL